MGGFFLYNQQCALSIDQVKSVFSKKGFQEPVDFNLSNGMHLLSFRKQLIDVQNFYENSNGNRIFLFGTCTYKGLDYQGTLSTILNDFCSDKFDSSELLGNFCILIDRNNTLECILDPLFVYSIFTDNDETCFSSSFLALLVSTKYRKRINELALYEKLSTGYIIGPDTLIEGIYRVDRNFASKENLLRIHQSLFSRHDRGKIGTFKSFGDAVDHLYEILNNYLIEIKALAEEFQMDLGLSGGYDSRLLLALSIDNRLHLKAHTHFEKGMHDTEGDVGIARELTRLTNIDLTEVQTRPIMDIPEDEVEDILTDGLYYFDGRNSHNMGAFSESYTRKYKIRTLEDYRLSLNGLGGEIFRNYYFSNKKRVNTKSWMDFHIYYPNAWFALNSPSLAHSVKKRKLNKISIFLGNSIFKTISFADIRRYYSEIRMPECDGINNNAHNQLVFYLTPFIENSIIQEAYKVAPFIGLTGRFEAGLIKKADSALASVRSRYGFAFSNIPFTHTLYGFLKSTIPPIFWVKRNNYRIKKKSLGIKYYYDYVKWIDENSVGREIDQAFKSYCPGYRLEYATRDNAHRATIVFLGSFFREFDSFIKK